MEDKDEQPRDRAPSSTWVPPERFDEFRLLRPLGRGTMGQVFLGHDTQLDRPVAIKFLAALDPGPAARERFLIEARAIARLSHQNVVAIHRVGEVAGRPYLVSELVRGTGLDQIPRPMPWPRALALGRDLSRGLSAAHAAGVLHRDLKPANVIVADDGTAKLLDFGLAKLLSAAPRADGPAAGPDAALEATLSFSGQPPSADAPGTLSASPALTAQGALLGTPLYMAPELWRGEAATPASDVYALGALLYELCSGQAPHPGGTLEELRQAAQQQEPRPLSQAAPGVDARLSQAVDRCLRRDPAARFASAQELCQALSAIGPAAAAPGPRRWPLVLGSLTVLALGAAGLVALRRPGVAGGPAAAIDSLAVLPFENAGGDPDTAYLGDGITEGLLNDLSQLPRLKVIARASVFRYQGKAVDPLLAGRELGVRAVLTGRVLQRGDGLSISAELTDVGDNRQLWGERYERRRADVGAVQQELARAIAGRLRPRLSGDEQGRLGRRYTDNAEAYDLYLKGSESCRRGQRETLDTGIRYLQGALRKDPGYALAHAGLAYCYTGLIETGAAPAEVLPRARAAVQRALELDDGLAEAHAALAFVRQVYDWDFPGAEREYARALALNPGRAETHHQYSHYLINMGRNAESLAESRRALELDPLDPIMTEHMGFHFLATRKWDEAISWFRKTLALEPTYFQIHLFLGTAYEFSGRRAEAIEAYRRSLALNPQDREALMGLARVYARSGRRPEALRTLAAILETGRTKHVSPMSLAGIQVALGERERAFQLLEQAYREHDGQLNSLKHDFGFDELRPDPRFQDLLRRIGLPP